jgi:hypothetical protein
LRQQQKQQRQQRRQQQVCLVVCGMSFFLSVFPFLPPFFATVSGMYSALGT